MAEPVTAAAGGTAATALATAGAIAGALMPVAGSIIQNVGSARQAKRAQAFSERMRNTQHQAEVKDLIDAGLNPILSAGGSGASSPEGVFFQPENIFKSSSDDIRKAFELIPNVRQKYAQSELTSALKVKTALEQENVKATNELIKSQQKRELTAADVNSATAAKIRAETPEKAARSSLAETARMGASTIKKAIERAASSAGKAWIQIQREPKITRDIKGYYWDIDLKKWKPRQ